MTRSLLNRTQWLLPLVLISILLLLPTMNATGTQRKSNLIQRISSLRDIRTKGLLLSKLTSTPSKSLISRQGAGGAAATAASGLASSLLSSGPMTLLALSSLLFSFPVLPMLFLAPMAISNFLPNMEDVADPSINDIIQSVQNIGQGLGLLNGNKPITGSISAGSTSSSASGSSASGSFSSSDSTGSQSGSSSTSSSSSNIISAIGSASEPIASIVAAPSSSGSSGSSPPKSTLGSQSSDNLADLSTGFLSQLAAINEILSNNNPSSENPMSSFSQLAANTLSSLSNLLFSSRREESGDKKVNKYRLPFTLNSLGKSHSIVARSAPNINENTFNNLLALQSRGAFTDRLAALRLQSLWSRSSGAVAALIKRFRDVYSTFREGLKRYEISESECQARLICELNQKAVGRSVRNWAKVLTDFIRFDEKLETLGMGGMAKSTLIDLYQAARKGMSDEECAAAYSRCPVNIAVEPVNNSIMSKLFRRNRVKQSSPTQVPSTADSSDTVMITGNQVYTPGRPSESLTGAIKSPNKRFNMLA